MFAFAACGDGPNAESTTSSTPLQSDEYSLFADTMTPRAPSDPDSTAVEIGVRFRADVDGALNGVRFYKGSGNGGSHLAHVWTSAGTLLRTQAFTGETSAGWQTVRFTSPLAIKAGQTYVASYHTDAGHYAGDNDYFTGRSVDSGPLHAPADTTAAHNGVYHYGATAFPSSSYAGSNYWVDVIFKPATPSGDGGAPKTDASLPGSDAGGATSDGGGTTTDAGPRSDAGSSPSDSGSPTRTDHCASSPHACGYPDATNTGITPGTVLKQVPAQIASGVGWHWDTRGWLQIDGDGAVLDGLEVHATVDAQNVSNVVIRNCRIVETGQSSFGVALRHTTNATVEHNEISGPDGGNGRLMVGIKNIYGDETGTKALANNIYWVATAVQLDSGLIQDNYIHDMGFMSGDHINGTTSNGGGALLSILHNTSLNQIGQTDAISLFEDFGSQHDRVIDDNLVAGGGYTIYGGANPGGQPTSNIKIRNNRFSKIFFPNGGSYGPVTAFAPSGSGNVWAGNVWDETGAVVNP